MADPQARKRIRLAAHLPGVDSTVVWSNPESRSQIEFQTFADLAHAAERGLFDFLFLAEGLRLRQFNGKVYDADVVGRPDSLTYLAALSAVTTRLGLAATVNTTFHEPYDLARKLATLEHLSRGRIAWNMVTTNDSFTGANFSRGGYLPDECRYERAREFLQLARTLWVSWPPSSFAPEPRTGWFTGADSGRYSHQGAHFAVHGRFNVPQSENEKPIIIQAGDSDEGREMAAETADIVFSKHTEPTAGRAFYRDVKRRLPKFGRTPGSLLVFTRVSVILGDTPEEAHQLSTELRKQQISPRSALATLGGILGKDLSDEDPHGPPPLLTPSRDENGAQGHTLLKNTSRDTTIEKLRRCHAVSQGSIVDLMRCFAGPHTFVGTSQQVAEQITEYIHADIADGVIVDPHIVPASVTAFVERVVPELQELGVYPDHYSGTSLRTQLGLEA